MTAINPPGARVLASSAVTGGVCSILELVLTAESVLPGHAHDREDQALIVLDGSLDVTVGDHRAHVHAGEMAFCPRGVVHQVVVTSRSARVLALQIPGGLEGFVVARASAALDPELLLSLAAEHGVRIATPPLVAGVRTDH